MHLEKSSSDGSEKGNGGNSLLAGAADNGRVVTGVGLALGAGALSTTVRSRAASLGALGSRSLRASLTLGTSSLGTAVSTSASSLTSLGTGTLRSSLALGASSLRAAVSASASSLATLGARALVSVVGRFAVRTNTAVVVGDTVRTRAAGLVGAAGRVAGRDLDNVGVVRSSPGVLERLVDDLAVLANVTVGRSVAGVVVVPVVALLRLVDSEAVAAVAGAVLRDVLRATLARARLRDVDSLAVALLTGVRLEDVDNVAVLAGLGVALAVVALVDSSDGLGLSGGGAGDGGGEDSGDGGLVGLSSGDDIGQGNIGATNRDVDSEEEGVGDGILAAADLVAAREKKVTTTELRVITRALNVTLISVNTGGVVVVDLVTTVAVPRRSVSMYQ